MNDYSEFRLLKIIKIVHLKILVFDSFFQNKIPNYSILRNYCLVDSQFKYKTIKQKMFLNLHSKNPKKLTLEPNLGRQTYLSHHSLTNLNKQKSYSAASLKDELRKFKNKSLSHAMSNNNPISQIKSTFHSPNHLVSKDCRAPYSGSSLIRDRYQNGGNMKINDFKKSYLNLDSKLNKCTRPKDYFKPIQQNSINCTPVISYIEVEKRVEQQNVRKQLGFLNEINMLRDNNEILRGQNQELRRQRSIDLEMIARQNQIMQKQQELIEASQEAINAKKIHVNNFNRSHDQSSYAFSKNIKPNVKSPLDCQDCRITKKNNYTQNQLNQITIIKIQEQNKYLKKQIHELVYQCEKYKEAIKKAEQKYQKQLEQNQKLITLIYQTDIQKNHQLNNKKQLNREKTVNQKQEKSVFSQSKPIYLKKEKGKIYYPQNGTIFKSNINTPQKNLAEKSFNTKSAINILKFSNQTSEQYENWEQTNNQEAWQKKYLKKQGNQFIELSRSEKGQRQREQTMQWCHNQNIRKYLQQINKQKAKEIEKIDYLLNQQ